jgi:hypothetical protein
LSGIAGVEGFTGGMIGTPGGGNQAIGPCKMMGRPVVVPFDL